MPEHARKRGRDADRPAGIGADRESEARAREQYYLLQAQVENSLSGSLSVGGSGTGQNSSGVYSAERRLRWLLGLPISDNRLIRPPATYTVVGSGRTTMVAATHAMPEGRWYGHEALGTVTE